VRLAAKLTGWKIDVKSEEKASAEDAAFIEEFDIGG
jgi:transcription antitermination factor NusA-like protein